MIDMDAQNSILVIEEPYALVIETGIVGPQGAPGSVETFVFVQGTPATEWIINHNLGYKPSVELMSTGGIELDAQVLHMSDNQVRVYFNQATAGSARLL